MLQRYAFLCLLLTWLPTAVFAQTITSFAPTSGNVGTLLTLSGTNLNLVTAVAINGTPGVLVAKTSTSVRVLVMPGTTSGPLTATGGAPATSSTAFAVTGMALNPTQQGPKLVGTGFSGPYVNQGSSVALSADGNTLAVGGAIDNGGAGATWVFIRNSTGWSQQGPKLVGTGGSGPYAYQGSSVALSADGNTLAVGGHNDNGASGATWVFTRNGTSWNQQGAKLVGTGAVGVAYQGSSVALSADGNTLAEGGYNDNGASGATWVFTRNGTGWSQQGPKLVGVGAAGVTYQGYSVALSADGNTLAEGGYTDNNSAGATWVFTRNGTSWSQQGPKLVGTGGSGPYAYQGSSVALSADGNTLAEGGYNDNSHVGATWVFTRNGTGWSQQGPKLVGVGAAGVTYQGYSVALSADGNTLAEGGSTDNSLAGATWMFTRNGTNWSQQGPKLVGTDAVTSPLRQYFPVALSADGTTMAVGGNVDNNSVGATWIFSTASSPLAQHAVSTPRVEASFFPNPVSEQITLNTEALGGTLRLLDNIGRSVLAGAYRNGQQLDLSTLAPGLYWLQLDQQVPQPLLKR